MKPFAIMLLLLSGALQAQTPSAAPSSQVPISDLKIDKTPEVSAICFAGTGNAAAYSDAVKRLYAYLLAVDLKPKGSLFSASFTPGPDAKNPSEGSAWDVCAEMPTPPNAVSTPFVLKKVDSQDAGHAICESTRENLAKCFSAVQEFVTKNGRTASLPPRYNVVKGGDSDPVQTYEVWLPLNPNSNPSPPTKQ